MPTTTVPIPTPLGGWHRRLPNELLSELVDWLPMAQFVGDTTMAPSPPRFGAFQMLKVQAQGKMRNVALIVYLDRARHKFEKVIRINHFPAKMSDEWDKKRDEEWNKKFNDVVQSMEKRDEEWNRKMEKRDEEWNRKMEKRDEEWHKKFNDVVQFVKGTASNASAPSGNILLEKGTSGIGYSVASGTTSHLPSSSYGVASGTSSHLPNSQKQQTDLSPGFFDILNQVQRETAPLETDQLQPSNVFSSAAPAKSSNILAAPPHGLPYSSVQQQNIFGSDQNDTSFLRQQQSGVDEYYSIPPPSSAKRRQQISIDQTDQIQSSSTSTKRTKFSSPSKSQQSCTSSPSKAKAHCPVVNCTVERATVAGLYDHVPLNHGEKVWEFAKLHDVRSGVDLIGINQDGTPYLTQPPTMGNNEDE